MLFYLSIIFYWVFRQSWKTFLFDVLTEYRINYDQDLITLMVHDYFYYHFNGNKDPSVRFIRFI